MINIKAFKYLIAKYKQYFIYKKQATYVQIKKMKLEQSIFNLVFILSFLLNYYY